MKIATWNVNSGTISDRIEELHAEYNADIVALQETAEPRKDSNTCLWSGDRKKNKGVSLSSRLPYERITFNGDSSPCVAAQISDSILGSFNILVLWAKQNPSYFKDLTQTIDLYSPFIRERPTVILGDFNMSVRLHSNGKQFYLLNARLNHDFDIHSAYHEFKNEKFGMETMTTLYHNWGYQGCYHCDFIYIPSQWISRLRSVRIPGFLGEFKKSDHRPVVCEFE